MIYTPERGQAIIEGDVDKLFNHITENSYYGNKVDSNTQETTQNKDIKSTETK